MSDLILMHGVLSVNESEAEVVKLIFHKYVKMGKDTLLLHGNFTKMA